MLWLFEGRVLNLGKKTVVKCFYKSTIINLNKECTVELVLNGQQLSALFLAADKAGGGLQEFVASKKKRKRETTEIKMHV